MVLFLDRDVTQGTLLPPSLNIQFHLPVESYRDQTRMSANLIFEIVVYDPRADNVVNRIDGGAWRRRAICRPTGPRDIYHSRLDLFCLLPGSMS